MTETHAESVTAGSWRELLGPKNLGASTVLAGGVALYATNEFLTISLLPSAVAEIGGHRFYAWVTTVYLVASVVAATTVGAVLSRLGPRWSYLSGLAVFGTGSLLCATAPTMELLLVGRTVQGAAGGLLAGLATPSSMRLCRSRCGCVRRRSCRRCGGVWVRCSDRPAVDCSPSSVRGVGHSASW